MIFCKSWLSFFSHKSKGSLKKSLGDEWFFFQNLRFCQAFNFAILVQQKWELNLEGGKKKIAPPGCEPLKLTVTNKTGYFKDSNFWRPFKKFLDFIPNVILEWHLQMHKSGQKGQWLLLCCWFRERTIKSWGFRCVVPL